MWCDSLVESDMEGHQHQRRAHQPSNGSSSPMHLFGWMRRPGVETERAERAERVAPHQTPPAAPAVALTLPNRALIRELLWHLEQRESLLREEAWHLYLSRGGPQQECHRHRHHHHHPPLPPPPPPHATPRPLMPVSERRQLERLCARVPPSHTAAVLSRFREVLSTNEFLPWELVCVFKQVLRDFLVREEGTGSVSTRPSPPPTRSRPPPPPPPHPPHPHTHSHPPPPSSSHSPTVQGGAAGSRPPSLCHSADYRLSDAPLGDTSTSTSSPTMRGRAEAGGGKRHHRREEIPTISSYVDRHLGGSSGCPNAAVMQRDWSLPYCYSFPHDHPGACNGTTL
ncbi:protein enabled homolog [Engraulis encrasicolus]|uniref:protein enabled homolog n=1 Tax=Engraulis encrasicolus TaxID=184585 RepID=UPI002FD5C78F